MHAGVEKSGGITSVLVSMCQNFFFFWVFKKRFFSLLLHGQFQPSTAADQQGEELFALQIMVLEISYSF